MRRWLQDPKIVAGLGVFAVLYMVFTFWPKSKFQPASQSIENSQQVASLAPPSIPIANANNASIPMELNSDSLRWSTLDSIGWKRKSNRDPFVDGKRKGSMAYWVLREEQPLVKPKRSVSAKKKMVKPRYSLQAVAIGPGGKLALVSGRWYTEGVPKGDLLLEKITADSVVFKLGAKPQTLHFSTTR